MVLNLNLTTSVRDGDPASIVAAADALIKTVNTTDLAYHLGLKKGRVSRGRSEGSK